MSVCVCVLAFVIQHALYYCHLWFVWLYHAFTRYLINGTIHVKKLLNIKSFVIFVAGLY